MVNFGFSSCTVKIILYFSYEHYNFSKCLAPLTYYFTCLDLKSFCSLFKFFVITIKIRESTHISKLWAETAERCIFLFFNYQVHSQDKKRSLYKGDSSWLGPTVPEEQMSASKSTVAQSDQNRSLCRLLRASAVILATHH